MRCLSRLALLIVIAGISVPAFGQQNDDCTGASTLLSGVPEAFSTTAATIDGPVGTCNAGGGGPGPDLWYEWTAGCDGTAYITTCGSGYDTMLVAYAPGSPCPPTQADEVACSDLGCGGLQSELNFPVAVGETYLIKVGGWGGAAGDGTLTAECLAGAPANDDCATPSALTSGVSETFDLITASPDGPGGTCGGTSGNDIWFTWTADCDGVAVINTCGSAFDTVLTVYNPGTACPADPLDELACSDLGCGGLQSEVDFQATSGSTYLINVGGWNGAVGAGEILAVCAPDPLENFVCEIDAVDPEQVNLSWTFPTSQPTGYGNGMEIAIAGVVIDTILLTGTETSATYNAPPGTIGQLDFALTGTNLAGISSLPVNCTVGMGTILGDNCVDAQPAVVGANPFDNTTATTDGNDAGCGIATQDVWLSFTPASTEEYRLTLCAGTTNDTVLTVYLDTGVCPPPAVDETACDDDGCGGVGVPSEIITTLDAGQDYLIRVSGWNGLGAGPGTLDIGVDCGDLGGLACNYDCAVDAVDLIWVDNPNAISYEIFENGTSVGTVVAGSSSFQLTTPSVGFNTYEVIADCAIVGGGQIAETCDVYVANAPAVAEDLVLALSGLRDAGDVGANDSAAVLADALMGLGRTVEVFGTIDFDLYPCLDLTAYSVVWVVDGTFPTDYAMSVGELNLLAGTLASGATNVYLESGDQWGFTPVASDLDARDGIDGALDGDDALTSLDGQDATAAGIDLSGQVDVVYNVDQGFDWNDRLNLLVGSPDLAAAEAIWRNSDDTGTEPDFIVGVAAEHVDGSRMISVSFEFGGYALDPLDPAASDADRSALAQVYLDYLTNTGTTDPIFLRADSNNDGAVNIADAVYSANALFVPGSPAPPCLDAGDANDDGLFNIADVIYTANFLFIMGSPPPPAPFPACGVDATDIDALECPGFAGTGC